MTEKQLVKANDLALDGLGGRDQVREMKSRILTMLPGASKLSEQEILGLAQISVAHGLNPFNGEVWAIPGRGLMIGIKGLRKKAREQVRGNFWIDYREIIDPEERKRFRIGDGDLAFEARLYDTENITTFVSTVKAMTGAGMPWESVEKIIGTRPYSSGIGILKSGEQTKMDAVQCARKRAEANALKQRFDVPFGVKVYDETTAEVIDHEGNGPDWTDPLTVEASIKADQDALFPPEK